MDLDLTNIKLLRALQEDGRRSLREIAKALDVSTVTVINRTKELRKRGILKGFSAKVDPIKLGFGLTALINVVAERKHLLEIQAKISKHQNVCGVYDVTGEFDAVILARFKNIEELNTFVKKDLSFPGITRTYTQVAFNVVKEDFSVNL